VTQSDLLADDASFQFVDVRDLGTIDSLLKHTPHADVILSAAARRVILTGGGGAPIDIFRRRRRQLNVGGGGVWRRVSQE